MDRQSHLAAHFGLGNVKAKDSAEVERAVSAYNAICTTDRLALSNDNIRDYVMLYANNPDRKEKNTKRAETRAKVQKEKAKERQYGWREIFEPPPAKRRK